MRRAAVARRAATAGRLVGRARRSDAKADVAQLAERVLGKDEVTSSILVIGSSLRSRRERRLAASDGSPTSARGSVTSDRAT